MGKSKPLKQLPLDTPDWVFPWRPVKEARFPRYLALGMVTAVFAVWSSGVRIRVMPPPPWAASKAAVIHVTDDVVSRELTLLAREGGPFPTRVDPTMWAGAAAATEQAWIAAARWTPLKYVPALRKLPQPQIRQRPLAAAGQAVLPQHQPAPPQAPTGEAPFAPAPRLFALSGIRAEELPQKLPPFAAAGDAAGSIEFWRFLIMLDAEGHVHDCVSLAGGEEVDSLPLEGWLRGLVFTPAPAKAARWIAIGVSFTNQTATDGTDAR